MKDLIDELDAIRRQVGTGTLPAGDAHVVTLARAYAADIDDVWDAITDPDRIARWFLPVSGDLRLGGTYQLEGNAGGEIRACEPPHRLLVTWIAGEPPGREDSSIVEVVLERGPDDGTTLTLTHSAVVAPDMWDTFGPGAVGVGWDLTLVGLAAHVAGEYLGTPAELESNPEVHAAMAASSEAWGDAYRESGADAVVAQRAVAATTAFYVPVS